MLLNLKKVGLMTSTIWGQEAFQSTRLCPTDPVIQIEGGVDRLSDIGVSCLSVGQLAFLSGKSWGLFRLSHKSALRTNNVTVFETSDPHLRWEMIGGIIDSPTKVSPTSHPQSVACFEIRVPQEFPSITEALEYLESFETAKGSTVDIYLQSGFIMQEQVFVQARNLGWITIFAEDSEVLIDGNFLTRNRTQDIYGVITRAAFTVVQGGQGPRLGCNFRMINAAPDSSAATGRKHGLFVSGPNSGCNVMNFRAFRNCGDYGVYANRGAYINCYGVDVSGAGRSGVYANRAMLDAQEVNASNCGDVGILALYKGVITATGGNADNCGVRASFGSEIVFNNASAKNVTGSAVIAYQSNIDATGTDVSGANGQFGRGIDSQRGSIVVFTEGIADNCSQFGLHATRSGVIEASDALVRFCGEAGLQATAGGRINFSRGDARRIAGEESSQDIVVLSGGFITAIGAEGGTNVTPQTTTVAGQIYKFVPSS